MTSKVTSTMRIWGAFFFLWIIELEVHLACQTETGYIAVLERAALLTEGLRLHGKDWILE